jgi:hypothetical protein
MADTAPTTDTTSTETAGALTGPADADTTAPVAGGPATTAPPASTDTTDWKAQTEKWRALARKHETAAKDNADAAKRLLEIEDSQKTEQQKLTDKLAAAEKELAGHRVLSIRAQAAREAGLDADMAQFLTESEPDSALAQAKVLAKRVQPAKPDLRQGPRTTAKPADDMNAWLRRTAGYSSTP